MITTMTSSTATPVVKKGRGVAEAGAPSNQTKMARMTPLAATMMQMPAATMMVVAVMVAARTTPVVAMVSPKAALEATATPLVLEMTPLMLEERKQLKRCANVSPCHHVFNPCQVWLIMVKGPTGMSVCIILVSPMQC